MKSRVFRVWSIWSATVIRRQSRMMGGLCMAAGGGMGGLSFGGVHMRDRSEDNRTGSYFEAAGLINPVPQLVLPKQTIRW